MRFDFGDATVIAAKWCCSADRAAGVPHALFISAVSDMQRWGYVGRSLSGARAQARGG